MKTLRGKHALLTGASRGIGPHIARALAGEGVHLSLVARSAEPLADVAQQLNAPNAKVVALAGDIGDDAARAQLVARAEMTLGPIDILINNAGIAQVIPFARQAPADVRQIVETNLTAALLLSGRVLNGMLQRGCGHIVNIASLHGKFGAPYHATYSATKAALIAWTSAVHGELEGRGVSVSVICPGFVSHDGMWASVGRRAPRLLGESSPAQVARAVLLALRNDAHEIVVNPTPVRLMLALNMLAPNLVYALLKRIGYLDYARAVAAERQAHRM